MIISACASRVSAGPITGASVTGGPELPFCQSAKLLADDGATGDQLGSSVSVSGDVALVGAHGDDDNGLLTGAAYVFRWNGTAWVQEQKLHPDDAAAISRFGWSVSISGNVALVGSFSESAFVFRWNGTTWVQEQKLLPDDGAEGNSFGLSVSISGDVALVRASGSAYVFRWNGTAWVQEQKLQVGSSSVSVSGDVALIGAYVFRWNGTLWIQEGQLLADDGAAGDGFGGSVSVSGDVALVGARLDDDNGFRSGSAYVFRWNGTAWVQEGKLLTDDGAPGDQFGESVSVSGNVALVGARFDDDNGSNSGSGYVFRWNGTAWIQEQKLLADDGTVGGEFGNSVSLSGDVALLGAHFDGDNGVFPGSAYVFSIGESDCNLNGVLDRCDIANGTSRDLDGDGVPDICTDFCEVATLLPDEGGEGDRFGLSVSFYGDVALIGASFDDDNGTSSGSAYVFRWNGSAWVREQKLLPDDGAAGDFFGWSASVSGDVALVGALWDDENGSDSGSAYIFRWNGTAWIQEQKLLANDGAAGDSFGSSVFISGDVALIGAPGVALFSGSAYVFRWNGTAWVQEQKLQVGSGRNDLFGYSASVSGDVILVGSPGDDDNGSGSGSAYVFRWNGTSWGQVRKLLPNDGFIDDSFGESVSVSGDLALVGAIGDDDNLSKSGSAYVFRRRGTSWLQEQKLLPDDGAFFEQFGWSVSASGDTALVGRSFGAPTVFRWNGTAWVQEQKLQVSSNAVSVSGDVALVGIRFPGGSAKVFSIGVTDCNQNDVFDACDIGTGTSNDCEFSEPGIPDECEVPQTGAVVSNWVGEFGFWDDPPDFIDWCLPEVPDNNQNATFDVLIDAPTGVVVLNTSPTVSTLSLLNEAVVLVDDRSGANVRTLAVDERITNSGVFRATDRERLVLDAPVIDQGGVCGEGGVLEAIDGVLGEGEEDDKSILEINGAVVLGGIAQTIGDNSEIHLIGGAELIDVCVDGVIVPDGQTGAFSGRLDNNDVLMVRGSTAGTRLGPTTIDAVLDSTSGGGSIRLTSQSFARLGDFKSSFTNMEGHRIEGAGIIFGGMNNEGTVEADNDAGEDLIIFPPGQKINAGILGATGSGTLRIETTILQTDEGVIQAKDGGTVLINAPIEGTGGLDIRGGVATISNTRLTIIDDIDLPPGSDSILEVNSSTISGATALNITGGTATLTGGSHVELDGPVVLCPNTVMDPAAVAELHVFDSIISATSVDVCLGAEWSWDATAELELWGGIDSNGCTTRTWTLLEAAGLDDGPGGSSNPRSFRLSHVTLADDAAVALVDLRDNGNRNGPSGESEVVYAETLTLGTGATLNLNGLKLYAGGVLISEGPLGGGAVIDSFVRPYSGDVDGDGDADLEDFSLLQRCFTGDGTVVPGCEAVVSALDANCDGQLDLIDFHAFQTGFGGP